MEFGEVNNDELFSNSRYVPDALFKEENEAKQHAFEFNDEETDEMHMMQKEKQERMDYKDFEK